MDTISKRILKIRKRKNLSRAAFGEKIGVSQDVINNIERGRNKNGVPDNIIKLISITFEISEDWIRTGNGDPEMEKNKDLIEEISSEYNLDDFQKKLVLKYLNLTIQQKAAVKSFLDEIYNDAVVKEDKTKESTEPTTDTTEKEETETILKKNTNDKTMTAEEIAKSQNMSLDEIRAVTEEWETLFEKTREQSALQKQDETKKITENQKKAN